MHLKNDLLDLTNYKIYIQQKRNRKLKYKTKFLTPDFSFSESEEEALEIQDFQEAEILIKNLCGMKNLKSKPRIFIKYIGE